MRVKALIFSRRYVASGVFIWRSAVWVAFKYNSRDRSQRLKRRYAYWSRDKAPDFTLPMDGQARIRALLNLQRLPMMMMVMICRQ